jgi:1-acyl-sn-glycerol-3-phosphate acyltransferase
VIYVVRYLLVALYTVIWGSVGVVVALVDRSGRGIVWVARHWVRWVLGSCGIQVDVDGLENLAGIEPCVLMSNHQSVFDIAAIVRTLPLQWKFVAKRELTRVPFFGWAVALSKQIVVDRANREASVRSLKQGAARVRAGANVIIFPEGTRSVTPNLGPFKSGGFHLAIQAGVPVVPVSVSGSWRITPKRALRIESGRILVRYGPPIPTAELDIEDRSLLKDRVRAAIVAGFDPELQGSPE